MTHDQGKQVVVSEGLVYRPFLHNGKRVTWMRATWEAESALRAILDGLVLAETWGGDVEEGERAGLRAVRALRDRIEELETEVAALRTAARLGGGA